VEVYGIDELRTLTGPAVIVANHASHLDTAVLLSTLPAERRRRYSGRGRGGLLLRQLDTDERLGDCFQHLPPRGARRADHTPARLLAKGWTVVVFPEGTRVERRIRSPVPRECCSAGRRGSCCGHPGGILGTYAAMPRGSYWPVPGRPRVSVRYGAPISPRPAETPQQFGPKIAEAVKQLLAEDAASWWRTQRGTAGCPSRPRLAGGVSGSKATRRSRAASCPSTHLAPLVEADPVE
jgi:1-acyl-sn-glycerol-3-phosphate acyltransferase